MEAAAQPVDAVPVSQIVRLLVPVRLYLKESVERLSWLATEIGASSAELHIVYLMPTPAPISEVHLDQVQQRLLRRFDAVFGDKANISRSYYVLPVLQSPFTYEDPASLRAAALSAAARNLSCSAIVMSSGSDKWRDAPLAALLVGHSLSHFLYRYSQVPICCKGQALPINTYSVPVVRKLWAVACSPAGEQHIALAYASAAA